MNSRSQRLSRQHEQKNLVKHFSALHKSELFLCITVAVNQPPISCKLLRQRELSAWVKVAFSWDAPIFRISLQSHPEQQVTHTHTQTHTATTGCMLQTNGRIHNYITGIILLSVKIIKLKFKQLIKFHFRCVAARSWHNIQTYHVALMSSSGPTLAFQWAAMWHQNAKGR